MAVMTVLVAPAAGAAGVLDALRDWAATGMLGPFIWVDSETATAMSVPALKVQGRTVSGGELSELLTTNQFELVRVCVLVPDGTSVSWAAERYLADLVQSLQGPKSIVRIRIVLYRPGAKAADERQLARLGWHNVLLSPEDGEGPGRGTVGLRADNELITAGIHDAAGVAAVAGLWAGAPRSTFDTDPILPGENVRIVRSFYRKIDARAAERELQLGVAATSDGLPRPNSQGVSALYVDDVPLATSTMANSLWLKHSGILKGPRVAPSAQKPKPLNALQVLAMFFGFLWSAIKNAPAQWFRSTVNKFASASARAVHNSVFGSAPAAFTTVVGGRTPDGTPVGWLGIQHAADHIASALPGRVVGQSHLARADLSRLWQDYTAGALTLADAGRRVAGLDPVQIQSVPAVIRNPQHIAPGMAEAFVVPGNLLGVRGNHPIMAFDVAAAEDLSNQLGNLSLNPQVALEADRCGQQLRQWRQQHSASYAVQVGSYLGQAMVNLVGELREILARIEDAAGNSEAENLNRAKQRRLARLQRWLLIGLVLGLLVMGGLAAFAVITMAVLIIVAAALLFGWIVVGLSTFVRSQRAFFRDLNRRKAATSQAAADEQNLRSVVEDLIRVGGAYAEFLCWSQVVGAVLAEPFGRMGEVEQEDQIPAELPSSVRIGTLAPPAGALAEVVARLRTEVFGPGWLSGPWNSNLAAAADLIGPTAYALRAEPELLYSRHALEDNSELQIWSDRLAVAGPSGSAGDDLKAHVVKRLSEGNASLSEGVLDLLAAPDAPSGMPVAVFMAGVGVVAPADQYVRTDVLTAEATTAGAARVDVPGFVEPSQDGLSRIVVQLQKTDGLPPYDFSFGVYAPPEVSIGLEHMNLTRGSVDADSGPTGPDISGMTF